MLWAILIGLLVHGLLTGLIIYYGTGQNLDVIEPGQNSKISQNYYNYYLGEARGGLLGMLRTARRPPQSSGRDVE
jgi:hypothetical protein